MKQQIHWPPRNDREAIARAEFNGFELTDGIRVGVGSNVIPQQGYRTDMYTDIRQGFQIPVLAAAVTREQLFELFLDLLDPLGEEVDVVLETSHASRNAPHSDLWREYIDLPILKSKCLDYEELLMHDGCTGIAVLSNNGPLEVQFDEHKLLVVYASDLKPFQTIMKNSGILRKKMKLITEGPHLHSTDEKFTEEFGAFAMHMGIDGNF